MLTVEEVAMVTKNVETFSHRLLVGDIFLINFITWFTYRRRFLADVFVTFRDSGEREAMRELEEGV